jgi:hypothetical protein
MATSMIRPHPPPQPPPPRPPLPQVPTNIQSYDSLSASSNVRNSQDLEYLHKIQDGGSRQDRQTIQSTCDGPTPPDVTAQQSSLSSSHIPLPLRYGHPLPRTNSYPPQNSQKEEHRPSAAQAEHMLRRKTPNGILNAAYDGTSVEQMDRPHAMKHILLPVTEHFGVTPVGPRQAISHALPLRPTLQQFDSGFGLSQQSAGHKSMQSALQKNVPGSIQTGLRIGMQNGVRNGVQNGPWMSNAQYAPEHAKASWTVPQLPQIDSMLNQIPSHSTHLQYLHNGHSPFAFMPPAFQPSFGPTASNDSGPFGPYWPNGTFVPYRPAALRDMRYYPHHTSTWASQPVHNDPVFQNPAWYSVSQHRQDMGSMSFPATQQFAAPPQDDINTQLAISKYLSSQPFYNSNQSSQSNRSFRGEGSVSFVNNTPGLRVPPVPPLDLLPRYDSGLSSGQTTPTPRNYQSPSATLREFGPGSSNAQLRERVFSWAHSVYIDLLKHLHSVRRRGQQTRHGSNSHSSGPNIYPRPPRQPSCDFSSSSGANRSRSSVEHRRFPPPNQEPNSSSSHKAVGLEHDSIPHGPAVSPWRSQGRTYDSTHDNQTTWQSPSALTYPLNGLQHSRTLRRTPGTLHAPHHAGTRPEIAHVASATSALDSIGEICQSGDWKWVDGLLLGGCLAYALGDYEKAAEWYSKILGIDGRYVTSLQSRRAELQAAKFHG